MQEALSGADSPLLHGLVPGRWTAKGVSSLHDTRVSRNHPLEMRIRFLALVPYDVYFGSRVDLRSSLGF